MHTILSFDAIWVHLLMLCHDLFKPLIETYTWLQGCPVAAVNRVHVYAIKRSCMCSSNHRRGIEIRPSTEKYISLYFGRRGQIPDSVCGAKSFINIDSATPLAFFDFAGSVIVLDANAVSLYVFPTSWDSVFGVI